MKVTVVQCECGTTQAHRKFQTAENESQGFFSIEAGKQLLEMSLNKGLITQTDDETAATLKELESCGLPATKAEALAAAMDGRSTGLPETILARAAKNLRAEFELAEDRRRQVAQVVQEGLLGAEDGEKILALAAEIKQ
ncbi:MAG: hypothetical protein UW46_C0003G0013 [Candidatus Yanofskybacteria bacterium GW2011_GWF1_44_227]|uniref:Uncharacterized protein n=1 Tax=Candidatus Yanofskybacteria bacterium GW2011_GWE2_40_11 TaxID=1619033 RepID=A0A0G0TTJ6_9BACT|nr:MAG: hypothetical protein UT69_C0008G0044 [Candidatus Yanofskybacteria bacterium GW2011_GWE1_40_10]KKR41202.1 MAG: hypothetical protein UT75_C0001G0106 [Candidatus Yanofskybacteria bacterium GW2011_GWE2_40_11]KKT15720.1 MAG: hypothetical protein UV97_C0003G0052 [Candidatus Yanofskybacteria bacterium GW2011_GWF2_43_596]KKT53392.1 MAG: hypothetical protein UW46_C0003G0013 [Candidatus Yanofskybacteria bacterium GW2011_GWF1_44_227]HBT80971.1 hypothetical protein [Candidatus Yanofskybacteria bact